MISHDEARTRGLGPFRGLLIGLPVVTLAWAPIIALLIERL